MFSNAIKNRFFAKPVQRSSNVIAYPPSISSSRGVWWVICPKIRQNPTFGAILGHLYPLYPPKLTKNTSIYAAMHVHMGCEQLSRKYILISGLHCYRGLSNLVDMTALRKVPARAGTFPDIERCIYSDEVCGCLLG
jgi:hypothetical protein